LAQKERDMKLLIGVASAILFVMIYVLWLRAWLKQKSWAQGFFSFIEPVEIALWSKSETILWARAKQIVGLLLTALTTLGAIDLTPLMPFVPDQYESAVRLAFNLLPLLLTVMGSVDVKLRQDTTKPLEVVALPEDVSPKVAAAIKKAKVASAAAVAAAVVDKAKV
jgi:hypothetical protein